MRRIPLWIVLLLSTAVVAGVWFAGTRPYDFLAPPTEKEIARAKARATQEMARPSDLFALPPVIPEPVVQEEPESPVAPEPPPPPSLPLDDLPDPLPQDFWADLSDYPAVSFLLAGGQLEVKTRAREALTAYERVIDHSSASEEEIETAVKGIRRNRALIAIPAEATEDAPKVKLRVRTPPGQVDVTRRAARLTAESLAQASFRQLRFEAWITADRGKQDHLTLILERPDEEEPASAEIPVTGDVEALRHAMLAASYRIVASALALDSRLSPISQPAEGEPPDDSLSTRITRRAWSHYASGGKPEPENP